jgi:hypothetical protein
VKKIAIGLVAALALAGLAVGVHLGSRGTGMHCQSARFAAPAPPFHNECDVAAHIERSLNRQADLVRSEAADRRPGDPLPTPVATIGRARCVPFASDEISCTATTVPASAAVDFQFTYTYRTRRRAVELTLFYVLWARRSDVAHRVFARTGVVTPQQYGLRGF